MPSFEPLSFPPRVWLSLSQQAALERREGRLGLAAGAPGQQGEEVLYSMGMIASGPLTCQRWEISFHKQNSHILKAYHISPYPQKGKCFAKKHFRKAVRWSVGPCLNNRFILIILSNPTFREMT